MDPFFYSALPSRVVFGFGTLAQTGEEVKALGSRALVLSTPEQAATGQALVKQLGDLAVGLFSGAAMHTPTDVTETAMQVVKDTGADVVVAIGGGSTIGLGKAIALRTDLPQVVIPTTYAGSEATPILGQTENGLKTTQRNMKILPETIIYDVDLTFTLPARMTITSGMNAIAHAVEALYAKDRNPIISMLAEDGIRAIARSIPAITADSQDREGRSDALYGAWACGTCLGAVGMSIHHKLCHTLGGTFDLSHADVHTIIIPHATAYNAEAAPEAMAAIVRALGVKTSAARGLYDLAKAAGAPTALKDIGMPEDGLDRAADLAVANPYWNPRPIERDAIRALLDDAFYGRPPK